MFGTKQSFQLINIHVDVEHTAHLHMTATKKPERHLARIDVEVDSRFRDVASVPDQIESVLPRKSTEQGATITAVIPLCERYPRKSPY